ncbi:DUF2461 domain-containing protein [Flagellimonas pacifica]|uniref:TIGR02453 family protein n=1 Tax=Flagellimonas pacifica TaxID=1247520 RepID=A0A285MEA6_9FLAO|nr:DUF2461 domain-containing protein [Allomuricauda parva]SNY95053.1 TIGR02453 family protein [Allomuricauda parva]
MLVKKAYSSFFLELAKNNNKEWFHANKKRYENDVKKPFLDLLESLLDTLTEWDPRILSDPKNAMFRINRDVRFAKDKTPYHTILKAGFSPNGKKSILPGYYLGIDATSIHVGGGLFMLRPPELSKVRNHIAKDSYKFIEVLKSSTFIQNFGKLSGEKAKRLDRNLLPVAEKTDLIYNKQFYAMAEFPLEPFYDSEKLNDEVLNHFEAIKPLNTYLNQAFN